MFQRLIGALLALLLSGLAWSSPCAPDLPERVIPQADGNPFTPEETIRTRKYDPPSLMAERGFDHLVGMWNASTVYPCERARPALIEFRKFEVVRLDPSSGKLVVAHTLKFDGSSGSSFGGGGHWHRSPEWFTSGQPERQPMVASIQGGVFRVDLKSIPNNILHMWTDRVKAVPGHIYGIRMQVRITGDARLQPAMDYWRAPGHDNAYWTKDCLTDKPGHPPPDNCEAWLGDWIGDTGGKFVTILSPRSLLGNAQ